MTTGRTAGQSPLDLVLLHASLVQLNCISRFSMAGSDVASRNNCELVMAGGEEGRSAESKWDSEKEPV